jgi:hypothetical protein
MPEEPASLILELLRQMRAELATKSDLLAVRTELKSEVGDLRSEVSTLRADVASDMLSLRKELGDQIVGLRRAVIEYYTSIIGHGGLISELEARMRRVEQHLNLPSLYPA